MEEPMLQPEITRNPQEVKEEDTREPEKSPGQLNAPWSVEEIRSFIQEWEFLKRVMYPKQRKKNQMLSKSISQGLRKRGMKKSWQQCLDMLISLTDVYWTVQEANQKPRTEPLPCPFGEALQRIMDHSWEDRVAAEPPHTDMGNLLPPEFQLQAGAILTPLEAWTWTSLHVVYVESPQVPGWAPWTLSPLWTPPLLYPAILLEESTAQQRWSTSSDSDTDPGHNDNWNLYPNSV